MLSRTTRRVALTEAGALYFRRIQALLDELASASLEVSDIAASPQGLLRLSLPVTFGRQWIAPLLLPSFLARHPQIRIDARFTDRPVDVVAEGFDVAVRVGMLRDSSLTSRRMASYRNLLVASPGYLAAHGEAQEPDDLVHHACLGFTGFADWPDWPLTKEGTRKTVRSTGPLITADNSEALLMAAIEDAGITFTAGWLAGPAIHAGKLVEVLPGWGKGEEAEVHAIMPPGRLVLGKGPRFRGRDRQIHQGGVGAVNVSASWPSSVEAFEIRRRLADHIRNVVRNHANARKLVCFRFLKQPEVRMERGLRVQDTNKAVFSGHEGRQDSETQTSFDSRELCPHRMDADHEVGCASHVLQPLSQRQELETTLPTNQPMPQSLPLLLGMPCAAK